MAIVSRANRDDLTLLETLDNGIRRHFLPFSVLLLMINFAGCLFVIYTIPYTEIDWETYMIQVSSVVSNPGERDYRNIEGPTGPLVYPGAHVFIYSIFYLITSKGSNIRLAQLIFALLHTLALALVLRLYYLTQVFPLYLTPLLFLSRRVVSLFVLRLFNDAVQTIPLYLSLLLFVLNRWRPGCVLYSVAVAIKMNALLYAPGLAVLLCQSIGFLPAVTLAFTVCFPIQLIFAAPFIAHAPLPYLSRAFELTRKFLFKWSVNGAFLPESIFTHSYFAIALLAAHIAMLVYVAHTRWADASTNGLVGLLHPSAWKRYQRRRLRPDHVLFVLFSSNFIGIVFARTLHYQFYLWYAHSLLFLLWNGALPIFGKLIIAFAVEVVFNVYPPHPISAGILHVCHFVVLLSLLGKKRTGRSIIIDESDHDQRKMQ